MPVSWASAPRSRRKASSPPADAPMPTMGNELAAAEAAPGLMLGADGFDKAALSVSSIKRAPPRRPVRAGSVCFSHRLG